MTKQQKQEWTEFVAIMSREFGELATVPRLTELARLARQHGLIAERECNGHQTPAGDWDEAAAKRDEEKCERVEARIRALCSLLNTSADFQGDPRGSTVKIKAPSGRGNSFGGEGLICVPQ